MRPRVFFFLVLAGISCKQAPDKSGTTGKPEEPTAMNCAPQTTDKAWYTAGTKAPKLKGLEGINFKISTTNPEAQEYFNQGMMLSYGFNHAEAARSFFEVSRLDSTCAMAYWGFAYVLGPNYNAGMEDDNYQRAYQATQKALTLASRATKKSRTSYKRCLCDTCQNRLQTEVHWTARIQRPCRKCMKLILLIRM